MSICGLAYLVRLCQQLHQETDVYHDLHGTDPDDLDTERLDVVQFLDDAGDISDTIVIAVIERCRIDLVYCHIFPPWSRAGRHRSRKGM
jgi:hypothetical protein